MLATSGVYSITCLANGKRYIGQAKNMQRRGWRHHGLLRRGKHWNANLQASWNKYGVEQFEFTTVLVASLPELALYEQMVADFYRPLGLFNWGLFLDNGKRGRKLGRKARARIKAAVNTPEVRQKKVDSLAASQVRPEIRKNRSDGCKRNWDGNEARRRKASKRLSRSRNDPVRSKAWNAAIKIGHNTPEYLAKLRARRHTSETIAKMSAARSRYWANQRKNVGIVEVPLR